MNNAEKQSELNRLCRLLYERDKEFEKAKGRRTMLAILGFAVLYFVVLCSFSKPTGLNILIDIAIAIVLAGVHFWFNLFIFMPLFQKGREETERLDAIRKQISELEKTMQ